jgi:hypothetical protein
VSGITVKLMGERFDDDAHRWVPANEATRWQIPDPAGLVAEHFARAPLGRYRFITGCDSCEQICSIAHPCDCHKNFGKKFGGKAVRTTKPHGARFAMEPFIEFLQRKLAA